MASRLKPCPGCGGTEFTRTDENDAATWVRCLACGFRAHGVETWNRRTYPFLAAGWALFDSLAMLKGFTRSPHAKEAWRSIMGPDSVRTAYLGPKDLDLPEDTMTYNEAQAMLVEASPLVVSGLCPKCGSALGVMLDRYVADLEPQPPDGYDRGHG